MQLDRSVTGRPNAGSHGLNLALAFVMAISGCAAPAEPVGEGFAAAPAPAVTASPPARLAVPAAPPAAAERTPDPGYSVEMMLAYVDRIRGLQPAELAQEVSRLGEVGDSAVRLMQLAVALAQSRVAANSLRAQALLQRVLGQNDREARALHPLARLMAGQLTESRRAEEQIERQAQQLRDAQRRVDQLTERLEAVRAIERSLPSRPTSGASAPAAARP